MNETLFWILVAVSLALAFITPYIDTVSSGYQKLLKNVGYLGITCLGLYYIGQNLDLKDVTTWQGFIALLCVQIFFMCISYGNKAYIAPIRITLITMTLYGLLAQLTLIWSNHLFYIGPFNQVLNVIYLGVFTWLLVESPSGELKGGEIGRLEFGGTPFWWEIVISQGKSILPLMFGYEVMERRLAYSMAKSVQIGKGAKGTVGVRIWFKIVRPSTLSEYDVETQVKPEITRLFQSDIIAWARTVDDDTFINSLKVIEQKVEDGLKNGSNVLARFGIQVESIACADPEQSKGTDEAQAVIDMMNKLTKGGIDKVTATNMAMAMSGHAELVLMGLGGKGQGKNNKGSVIVDDDDHKGKKGGKADSSSDKKDEKKKLSDGPKTKGKGWALRAVSLIWAIHIIFTLLGWGKNSTQNPGDLTFKEVKETASKVVSAANPARNLPPGLPKSLKSVITLVDKGDKQWIVSKDADQFGFRDTDQDGWIYNRQEGYRDTIVIDWQFDQSCPSSICEIEAELSNGDIHTYISDENGWYHVIDNRRMKVNFQDKVKFSKRMRFKVHDPVSSHPQTIVIKRESLTYDITD